MPEIREEDYKNCVVVFLDLLGIGAFTKSVSDSELIEVYQGLGHMFKLVDELKETLDNEELMLELDVRTSKLLADKITITAMSDSIIMTLDEERIELIGILFSYITILHLYFLLNFNLAMRGGVTFGLIHHKKDNPIIFGKGLVAANDLQHQADYPRVIIDGVVISKYREALKDRQRIKVYEREFPDMKDLDQYFKALAGIDHYTEKENGLTILKLFNEQTFKGNLPQKEEYYRKIPEIIKNHTQKSWVPPKNKESSTIKEKWEYVQVKWDEFVKLHPFDSKR